MSLLTRKSTILAKIESVYGTDPTPTGAANAILIGNLTATPLEAELVERPIIKAFLGNNDKLLANSSIKLQFDVELAGSGAAGTAPAWGPLMKACGFAETIVASTSTTYKPVSASFPSITLYYYNDSVLHKATGARGTVKFGINVKQIPVMTFTFTSLYNAPADASPSGVDYTAFQMPKVANTTNTTSFSLLGYSGLLQSVELDMANDVQFRTLIGASFVNIIDRKPAGTFVFEAPAIATKDFFSAAVAGDTGTMTITHGTVAGNIVVLSCPRVSIQNPSYQDSQGVQMISLPFVATPDVGNDDISVLVQ